jgi:hypothetical protein
MAGHITPRSPKPPYIGNLHHAHRLTLKEKSLRLGMTPNTRADLDTIVTD